MTIGANFLDPQMLATLAQQSNVGSALGGVGTPPPPQGGALSTIGNFFTDQQNVAPLLAFGSTLLGGGNIGQAGLNFFQTKTAEEERRERKEMQENQRRLLAIQQQREDERAERRLRVEEVLAQSTIQDRAARQGTAQQQADTAARRATTAEGQLSVAERQATVAEREATVAEERASAEGLERFARIEKLDAETAQLSAETNAPAGVDTGLWQQALRTAEAGAGADPNNPLAPATVPVEEVLRIYNNLTDKPVTFNIDVATLDTEVQAGVGEAVGRDTQALQQRADRIAEIYGERAAQRFLKRVEVEARTAAAREQFEGPQLSVFERLFGG